MLKKIIKKVNLKVISCFVLILSVIASVFVVAFNHKQTESAPDFKSPLQGETVSDNDNDSSTKNDNGNSGKNEQDDSAGPVKMSALNSGNTSFYGGFSTRAVNDAAGENQVQELALETPAEVVVYKNKTVAGNDNTHGTSFSPVVKAKINGEWKYIRNKDITWSQTSATLSDAPSLNTNNGVVTSRGDFGTECSNDTITGTYGGLTVSYTVRNAVPVSTKEDMIALADNTYNAKGTGYTYLYYYALTNDIDYSSDIWEERYLKPIAGNRDGGIWSSSSSWSANWNRYKMFGATLNGMGFTIKNAVLPLGSYFAKNSELNRFMPYNQNFIGTLYGGSLKNLRFDGLVFENKDDAILSSMYTVAGNPNLAWLKDENNDGKDDATELPVLSENGVVSAIDIASIGSFDVQFQGEVTACESAGIVGTLINGTIDNIYIDADVHHMGGWYGDSLGNAGGVLVSRVDKGSTYATEPLMKGTTSKISNCIVVPSLRDQKQLSYNAFNFRGPGGILGTNANTEAENPDLVKDCAILIEKGSRFENVPAPYTGLNAYAYYFESPVNTTGLTNVTVFEANDTESAYKQFVASEGYSFGMFGTLWNLADINMSVYKGVYNERQNCIIMFGKIDNSVVLKGDITEFGIRVIRNGEETEGLRDGQLYELKFEKTLTAEGLFGIGFQDLAAGDYRAYVYAKFADNKEVHSAFMSFTSAN